MSDCQIAVNGALMTGSVIIVSLVIAALVLMANLVQKPTVPETPDSGYCPLHRCDPADCEDKHE